MQASHVPLYRFYGGKLSTSYGAGVEDENGNKIPPTMILGKLYTPTGIVQVVPAYNDDPKWKVIGFDRLNPEWVIIDNIPLQTILKRRGKSIAGLAKEKAVFLIVETKPNTKYEVFWHKETSIDANEKAFWLCDADYDHEGIDYACSFFLMYPKSWVYAFGPAGGFLISHQANGQLALEEKVRIRQKVFEDVFPDWDKLPKVMRELFMLHSRSGGKKTITGHMTIRYNWYMKLLLPLFRLTGTKLPPEGARIPVDATFETRTDSEDLYLTRVFHYGDQDFSFASLWEFTDKKDELIEYMDGKTGWRFCLQLENGSIVHKHRGYVAKLFGRKIPLPVAWIMGKPFATQTERSATSFELKMNITHPLFGVMYEYGGVFDPMP